MSDGTPAMTTSGPPGPITRVIIGRLWDRLFDDEPTNPIYLPRVIRDGYPKWGLPSYDPARPEGTSAPIEIPGVPDDVSDSACARTDMRYPPVSSGAPKLQLLNILFTNLSVMHRVSLTFSDSDPVFTAEVGVGTTDDPFTLAPDDASEPNYLFQIGCCEPESLTSRKCSDRHWTADAAGTFVAKGHDATVALTVELHTSGTQPLSISVLGIEIDADPKAVTVDFDVRGQPQWVQDLAQIALNEGVGNGALVQGLQSFLNQPNVIADIEKLANEALKNILGELPRA